MSDIVSKNIEEIEPYRGEHAIPGVRFRAAGKALGVASWGMNVLELDARCEGYPEHDHRGDGQEEVYVVLRGRAALRLGDGTERTFAAGDLVHVPPAITRKWVTGDEGVVFLALGGTPGRAYGAPR